MQPKVSMVMPCYNKEKWVSGMLDSVIAQEWDSIELILVNDGSTDNTRDVINQYAPKIKTRGYELVIIDQDNQGVSAAVRNGLMRITGDYVCVPDCDDELDPEYASIMARWLAENLDYEWVACDFHRVTRGLSSHVHSFPIEEEKVVYGIEEWLLRKIHGAVWIYMIRSDYIRRQNVIDLFYTGREGTQESQLFFPLVLGKGKLGYLRKPLYKYNYYDLEFHYTFRNNYELIIKYNTGFFGAANKVISQMPIDNKVKERLFAISILSEQITIIIDMIAIHDVNFDRKKLIGKLISLVNTHFEPNLHINIDIASKYPRLFCAAIVDNICEVKQKRVSMPDGRIVAWGALGRNARVLLPCLKDTAIDPDELWDVKGDGSLVKTPDIDSLKLNDFVLIFPSRSGDIHAAVASSMCRNLIHFEDILTYAAALMFPMFYDGSLRFMPL